MAGDDDQIKNKDGEGYSSGITYDSPYYLHPFDYPKQLHVNEVLTDNNFADWSQEMTNFLFAKNKIEFVDGTIKKPEKNFQGLHAVDANLNKRFGKESASRAYELKQKIASTRQGGASVSTYFTQLRSIWDEAQSIYPFPRCSCNKCVCDVGKKINEHQEKERLYEFLMGLDAEFTVIRTQILATKPVPSLETAYHMVAEDERQRAVSNENINPHETAAFKAFQRRNGPRGSNKERSGTKTVKEGIEHCTECNKDGHKREGCFKLIGYPEWWPKKKGEKTKGKAACVETETSPIPGLTNEDYQYFLKHFSGTGNSKGTRLVANMAHKEDEEGEWIFDSGCTEYITYLSNILVNKKATHFEAPVVIPNGDFIPVKGKGDYVLLEGTKLNGVLYVLDFKCNLLSVSRLCHDLQCSISFFPYLCIMQGLQKRNLIGAGRCRGGLYRMKIIHGRKAMATTVETWHRRLGHASKGKLAKVDFLKTSINDLGDFCDSCAKAKHTRLLFPSSFIKTSAPFELIHCHIWGGYRVPSYTKSNHFLTIVDDFSRAVWIFLLKHKIYFKNTDTKGDKFEGRGKLGVFLGYPPRTKGYKILDLETRKIIVSRDVNFHEENFPFKNIQGNNESGTEEPIICHDCYGHGEPILAQNKEQNPMEQDLQMDHDQTNEPNGPHKTHDGDETGQINDEGQPNDDEFETNESNEGAEAQAETRLTRTRTQPSRFKDFVFSTNHKAFLSAITNNDEPKYFKQAAQDARWREAMQKDIKALEKNKIVIVNCLNKIQEIKKRLDKEFSVKDLGPLKYFLGIEVAKTSDGLVLSQRKYILDILKDSGKLGCKPSSFPIEQGLKLDKDITYSVNVLSQFVADPRNNHLEAANRVLRYLKATPGQGILLSQAGDPVLTAYCNSDWLGCSFTRRSRTGYFLLLGGTPISWKTKKQSVVLRSSAEAEYRAMASTVSEVIWVRLLLSELQVDILLPTTLFCDNQAARHIANNLVFHERTKHVEMDCYFVRERVESKEIIPMHISSKIQIADLLTKGLTAQQLQFLLGKIGIANLHAPS
ncbi:putative RNA-directed DNA polymerase [Tanacetum coccineum]